MNKQKACLFQFIIANYVSYGMSWIIMRLFYHVLVGIVNVTLETHMKNDVRMTICISFYLVYILNIMVLCARICFLVNLYPPWIKLFNKSFKKSQFVVILKSVKNLQLLWALPLEASINHELIRQKIILHPL